MPKDIVIPSRRECAFGWLYALFCAVLLPYFLNFIFSLVGLNLSNAQLNLVYFTVNFLVVILVLRRFLLESGKELLEKLGPVLLTAIAGLVAYFLVSQLVSRFILLLKPDFFNANDQGIAALADSYYIPTLLCTVFLVPLTEECLFRGAVFGSIFKRSPLAAYAVSTVFFALVHIDGLLGAADPATLALSFLQYLPAGLCLAAAYHISGSIAAPILIHMAVNAIGILALR